MTRFTLALISTLLLIPAQSQAAISLQAESIGLIPSTSASVSHSGVRLGDRLLFSVWESGTSTLYSYDGQAITQVNNPLGVLNFNVTSYSDEGNWSSGAILNGEYYSYAQGATGTALYKTDGNTIDLVADFDPSTSTGQTVGGLIATDSYVYVRAVGPNGSELFRTDGMNTVEFDINPGPDSSGPYAGHRLGAEIVFLAKNPATGYPAVYQANQSGVSLLTDASYANSLAVAYGDSLYWESGDELYRYDGTTLEAIPEVAPLSSVQLYDHEQAGSPFVTLKARGPNGWAFYTWDGTTLNEYDMLSRKPTRT